jgi:hypothetical protein
MIPFLMLCKQGNIFGVSKSISTLQDDLTKVRIDVRLLQQEMKLHHIVTEQVHVHR